VLSFFSFIAGKAVNRPTSFVIQRRNLLRQLFFVDIRFLDARGVAEETACEDW